MPSLRRIGRTVVVVSVVAFLAFTGATWGAAGELHPNTAPAESGTLVGAMGSGYDGSVTALDEHGDTRWQLQNGTISYTDVSRLPNGSILAGYQDHGQACDCIVTGVRIIEPEPTPHVVWNYSFRVKTAHNSEVHDAEYLSDRNEILLVDMDRERVFTINATTKEITWQWNASEQYDAPPNPTETDWLHMNDVDRIGDGRYLVSVRNANQLLILERGAGVVEVINKDRSRETLYEQHNPQWLGDGAVLVADSENDRVVELHRNESTGEWEPSWTLYSANGVRFDWPRDADRLPNGNTLILDTRNERVVEVTEAGKTVWSAEIPAEGYDADRNGTEYPADLQRYTASGQSEPISQPFESIATLYGGIRYKFSLPHWFTEWHVLAGVLSLWGVFLGGGLSLYGRRRHSEKTVEQPAD